MSQPQRRLAILHAQLCADAGLTIQPLPREVSPFGALVSGISVRELLRRPDAGVGSFEVKSLRSAVEEHGFLLLRGQTDAGDAGEGLSCEELVAFGCWFGSGRLQSSHRVHPKAGHPDIFRVSNDPEEGCFEKGGVGTGGFHSDGFFLPNVYSHAAYQIVRAPESGTGHTLFASYGGAVARLAQEHPAELDRLRRLQVMSDTTGVMHPLVHRHPVTGAEVMLLGGVAGMIEVWEGTATELLAGGVLEDTLACLKEHDGKPTASWRPLSEMCRDVAVGDAPLVAVRRIEKDDLKALQLRLQELLGAENMHYRHRWLPGDIVVTDNLQVAHKAAKEAGDLSLGLRVLHRVTIAGAHVIE
eukprot:gnl/TRDRNA2_/TRDRNA2_195575_c0_seq1.p1 gnl/TRDRNA2_/TRDRNA2_195575_c0~~gnl/TRDRNA2_/TRDRNA2_195575_c0_seq1.p1  ORF type:complete len:364 (+),score=73.55 gnl/TRDRNA2_/TRDRNA2_195575_c0_seq1:24-1094(+)